MAAADPYATKNQVWNDSSSYLNKTRGISTAEKISAIEKLTGKKYDAASSGLNKSGFKNLSSGQGALQSMYTKPNRFGKGGGELIQGGLNKFGASKDAASKAQGMRDNLTSQAYDRAIKQGLYEKGSVTDEEKAKLGYMDPHGQWVSRTNRLTGERDFGIERVHKVTSGNAGLKGNYNRNQAAWQAGIGAVTGFVTGGPVGAVLGAASGYASGKPKQDAWRAERKAQYGGGALTPEKLKQLRDIARSRAAGAGTFNYTQQEWI